MNWFRKVGFRGRKVSDDKAQTGLWTKCQGCDAMLPKNELHENLFVCNQCGHHHRIDVRTRLGLILDDGSFEEHDVAMTGLDPLGFIDEKPYADRRRAAWEKTKEPEGIVTGFGTVEGHKVAIGVMNFAYMGGSMGSVVGEKIARIAEAAAKYKRPLIYVTASGGARMQEGILSLMQMAKTVGAISRHRKAGLLSISLLTDPTTGGTTASFATITDMVIAEPGALISFAGPRVIEQTIRQKLPEGFQRSEFAMEHGLLDSIVNRDQIRTTLVRFIEFSNN